MNIFNAKFSLLSIVIVFLCLAGCQFSLLAQEHKIESITVADGLAQGFVSSVLQDEQGFFWFATINGLDRYDGYTFKHFKNDLRDSTSLIDNRTTSIVQDKMGRIWISTHYNGIECFDPKTEVFHHFGFQFSKSSKDKLSFLSLSRTRDGRIWITSDSTYSEIIGVNDKEIRDISFTEHIKGKDFPIPKEWCRPKVLQSGDIFIYTQNSIEFKAVNEKKFSPLVSIPNENRKDFFVFDTLEDDPYNWIYINGNLYCYEGRKILHSYKLNFDLNSDKRRAYNLNIQNYIHTDKAGNLWMMVNNKFYKVLASELNEQKPTLIPIIDESICLGFYLDKLNKIWITTNGYGVRCINPEQPEIKNIYIDISPSNIQKYDENTLSLSDRYLISLDGEILDESKHNLFVKNKDKLYQLYGGEKLVVSEGDTEKVINSKKISHGVIHLDTKGRFWCFYVNGNIALHWDKADTLSYYSYTDAWDDNIIIEVNSVAETKEGELLLSTSKGLINIIPDEINKTISYKKYYLCEDLSTNNVLGSLLDPNEPEKYVWIGTKGAGLYKINIETGSCEQYTTENGLPNNVVYGILADDLGNLWLSTNLGLSQFNLEGKTFRNFTDAIDDLQGDEFNAGAYLKLDDGRLVFGGVSGLSFLDPTEFTQATVFGKITFTQLKINNKVVRYKDGNDILKKPLAYMEQISLKHDENFLTIRYAGLQTRNTGKTNYYYKMEGVDKNWVFAGEKTELSYPNLAPGNYTLKVCDVNEIGDRNPNYSSLEFNIASAWWASTLAYFIYGIIACSLLVMLFNFRLSRVKLQQELIFNEKEMQQMKQLDELKSRFFSNITHEFRTPLTLIIEPARQLLNNDSPPVKNQSSIIFNNAQKLLLFVNQLLDISKLEESKMKPTISHGDILPVIEEIVGYFKPLAVKNNQVLKCTSDLNELIIDFDKNIVEKVLYNLLSNALKFTPENGEINLHVLSKDAKTWQFVVSDTGVGIKKAEIAKIYDRFYQSDGSTTRAEEGSGIGLSLVKELVRLVNGRIDIDSTPDVGTVFTVTFLKSLASEADTENMQNISSSELMKNVLNPVDADINAVSIAPASIELSKSTILVVEDNKDLQAYIKGILADEGYHVLVADNGKQGVDIAAKHIPDIIISDVMMPYMDGFQLLEVLKKNIITSHIPIILLTAKGSSVSKIKGFRKGAHAYLGKPFNSEELMARLKQIILARESIQIKIQQTLEIHAIGNEEIAVKEQITKEQIKEAPQISEIDIEWIVKLKDLVETKIKSGSFSVDDLSSEMFMSRTQFFAKVKALTGLTPGNLVKNTRLDIAYQMVIKQPEISFAMIADSLGMADVKYFKKVFVKKFGSNPSEIRKSL